MPHRVSNFFRATGDGVNTTKASTQRRSSPNTGSPLATPREGLVRNFSYASSASSEDDRMDHTHTGFHANPFAGPPKAHGDNHHRLSFPGLHLVGGPKPSKEQNLHPYASLDWKIESPPVIFHGDTENSTGAIISGQLLLNIKDVAFEVDSFDARLEIHTIQKRPFQSHCNECANQRTVVKSWKLLNEPTALAKRMHEFPFSALLEGHLPATTDSALVTVRYEFIAEVKPKVGQKLKFLKNIEVRRALPVPEIPHHSVRIFPPTNIAASVHYTQFIHPIGTNTFQMRLDGIVKTNTEMKTVEYWKLKRLTWKLEEQLTTIAPACAKHSPQEAEAADDAAKKGLKRTEARTIGSADLTHGWKADYSPSGSIDMEIEYQANPSLKPVCDIKSRDGTEVTHQLVVEMVVVQEYAPVNNPKHVTPTGVARILRMHFNTVLTERGGLGVSWDNEAPPIYQDVPPSPPSYLCEIPYEEVEGLSPLSTARNSMES